MKLKAHILLGLKDLSLGGATDYLWHTSEDTNNDAKFLPIVQILLGLEVLIMVVNDSTI